MDQMKKKLWVRFKKEYGSSGSFQFVSAPGRVNIIGEHTDYNHGYVFPCGLGAHMNILLRPRNDSKIRITSLDLDEQGEVDLTQKIDKTKIPRWMHFMVGPGIELNKYNKGPLLGFDGVFSSTIPIGGGVSSSSALCVASSLAYRSINNSTLSLTEKEFLYCICEGEWRWSGVRGGIMDQYTSLNAKAGCAFVLDCRTSAIHPDYHHLKLPSNLTLIIANTNVKHELVNSPYNQRRASCERAAAAIDKVFPFKKVTHLRDADRLMLEVAKPYMDNVAYRRALFVVGEDVRTIKCGDALKAGDLKRAGFFVNGSHNGLRDLYEVSCEELDIMVDIARACEGCYGARMMGGGFGGCCIVLANPDHAENIMDTLRKKYKEKVGKDASVYATSPGDGAKIISFIPPSKL